MFKKSKETVKNLSKNDKIAIYRKKHAAIRHEYYTLANKYKDYNKYMLTFTIPSAIKGKTIKKGRFTKLRVLLKLRAFIAKEINNSKIDIKYFMNIELGKEYSNPHLHIQLWIKDDGINTSSDLFNKTIEKFSLNKNRCRLTTQTNRDVKVYSYVIKDYSKELSNNDLWHIETQKKRLRKQLGTRVRFYSKSTDKYSKRIYRILYYTYGILRDKANSFLDFFIDNFFYFSKKRGLLVSSFCFVFSDLSYIRINIYFYLQDVIFKVLFRCRDPPNEF